MFLGKKFYVPLNQHTDLQIKHKRLRLQLVISIDRK